jgi:capsular polysaccharide biosynthesis protein
VAEPLSLGQLGRVLLRYWLLIVLGTMVGGLLAFGVTRFMTPVYRATAIQLVKGVPGSGAAANYEAAQFAVSRAKTYPSFIYSSDVLEGVSKDLGNTESIAQLRKDLTATNPVETPLLEISATAPTGAEAAKKANSAAKYMAQFITKIESDGNRSPITVETAVQAYVPTQAASPKTLVIAALGALIGFALSVVFALINSYVRYQRRSAFRRKQAIGWVSADAAQPRLPAPAAARMSPQPERRVAAVAGSTDQGRPEQFGSQVPVPVEDDRTEMVSAGRPTGVEDDRTEMVSAAPAAVEDDRTEMVSTGPDAEDFLMMEVDPYPTTTLRRVETDQIVEEIDQDTVVRRAPVRLVESGGSAKQPDLEAVDSADSAESVDLDKVDTADRDDSADAAESEDERDDADALEALRTWKRAARR